MSAGTDAPSVTVVRMLAVVWACLIALLPAVSGCGLVKMPFRVAGAVVDGGYRATRNAARKTARMIQGDPAQKAAKEKAAREKEQEAAAATDKARSQELETIPAGSEPEVTLPGDPPPDMTPLPPPDDPGLLPPPPEAPY